MSLSKGITPREDRAGSWDFLYRPTAAAVMQIPVAIYQHGSLHHLPLSLLTSAFPASFHAEKCMPNFRSGKQFMTLGHMVGIRTPQ